ncbi:homeobox protein HEX homolog pha-2-like [Daphnia carinata]|uniref:homeobox protein HEX homolog pha-2-like n=1 Tax=Daphnia carinata TaxID=120202 RepID=UPI00257B461E|nr:homeobox protein HEX homolog pha-2-like [Daphnia carinata]
MLTMASKSFTIDHILHGHSTTDSEASVGETVYPQSQHYVPYWAGDSYCPSSSWPVQNPMSAALWLPQQGQPHHAMPVDLSTGTQRLSHLQTNSEAATPNLTPQSSMFNGSSNWMIPSAAMAGCWTSTSSPELLSYSHHHGLSTPLTSTSIPSPFFLTHQHPHQAAIRLAAVAARRHRHMPILHQQATRKGGQIRFTHRQSHCLEETFSSTRYLTPGQRRALANKLSLSERQVKTWFQNRRAKWRRSRKGEKLLMNVLPKIDNQATIDVFDDEEEEDDDELEFSSEDEKKKPTAINNKHKQ